MFRCVLLLENSLMMLIKIRCLRRSKTFYPVNIEIVYVMNFCVFVIVVVYLTPYVQFKTVLMPLSFATFVVLLCVLNNLVCTMEQYFGKVKPQHPTPQLFKHA